MQNEIETTYTTKAGKVLAEQLVGHIYRAEVPENWDECIHSIAVELSRRAEAENPFPVGSIIIGELAKHCDNYMRNNRVFVTINEVN
ncbi:MAG: hypothetical protein KIT33_15940 [Candidatus Kapabacteria bacterium]|nr:hypothetical protein [Ignavibacteriota bacterium]MCW5886463.1 hypothetical protein [Candidatus Kapabacteria bacterium]